jgi:predicted N-acyltransferase
LNNFHSVHFETCYYQAIEYCIKHKLARFEAGAQGHHKVARGLLPSTVYSAHKIQHPQFHQLLAKYTKGESQMNAQQQADINRHSPFKQEI